MKYLLAIILLLAIGCASIPHETKFVAPDTLIVVVVANQIVAVGVPEGIFDNASKVLSLNRAEMMAFLNAQNVPYQIIEAERLP